jgi:hypothetical protein
MYSVVVVCVLIFVFRNDSPLDQPFVPFNHTTHEKARPGQLAYFIGNMLEISVRRVGQAAHSPVGGSDTGRTSIAVPDASPVSRVRALRGLLSFRRAD